ncbi:MAG: Protein OS-9 [Candelina submexicana]|nr:MAG: Protein OS-9 [Candelina submexicana]
MIGSILWLAIVSSAFGSQNIFSVHDDVLAFPQYEIIFSDTFISDTDAESRLAYAESSSSARSKATTPASQDPSQPSETSSDISHVSHHRSYDQSPAGNDYPFDEETDSYETMILKNKRFLCAIPRVSTPKQNKTAEASARAEEEQELTRATDRGWELLKELEGQCMYFISGWWSYSFCYNAQVRQFHQLPPSKGASIYPPVEDPDVPAYVLGEVVPPESDRWESEHVTTTGLQSATSGSQVGELQARGETRYLVQKLGGGTVCDLTGKDRKVEVQFHCYPQSHDRIGWIKEVSTCSYLMVIYTPRLCNDVAFLPPRQSKANPIACREIVPEPSIADWKERKANLASQLLQSSTSSKEPIIIGGTEIGAMQQVGKTGRRIEGGAVAGGPQYLGVLATSEGTAKGGKVQKLTKEELQKKQLDPELVENLKEEVQKMAGDKGWKLEVVDAHGVREMRGTVDKEDAEGKDDAEGKAGVVDEGEGSEEEYKEDL